MRDFRQVPFTSGGTLVADALHGGMTAARLGEGPVQGDGWHDERFCLECGHRSECTWSWGEVSRVVRGKDPHIFEGPCPKCGKPVAYHCEPTGPYVAIAVAQGWGGVDVLDLAQWLREDWEKRNKRRHYGEGPLPPHAWNHWPELADHVTKEAPYEGSEHSLGSLGQDAKSTRKP
jgi:hypothetical protein